MTLKANDTCDFNIALNLNVNYDLEYIELTVTIWNKKSIPRRLRPSRLLSSLRR